MVFHWSLSDCRSLQVSRTLLGILADFNNAVVWVVSFCLHTAMSSSSFTNLLVNGPSAPITIGITVIFMFHSFFSSLARCRYLFFFLSCSVVWLDGKVRNLAGSLFWLFFFFTITRPGRLAKIRWYHHHYYYYYYYYYLTFSFIFGLL